MKVLVTGANGQLGHELKNNPLIKKNIEWSFTDRQTFDISNLKNINIYLNKSKPDFIVNCAAFTDVDIAEDNFEIADIINHKAVGLIAKWCNDNNCNLLHISTDYVYDGNSLSQYVETDETNPLNNYGKTKLLGDIVCQKNNLSSIILRTSWIYSSFGQNFLTKMINIMQTSDEIMVVNDQFGSPTYAGDLAKIIIDLIINYKWVPGVYNYTNYGKVSWYDFAKEIKYICGFDTTITPISSEKYLQKARRPKFSMLDNTKIINTFNIKQTGYLDSLRKCVKIFLNES